MMLFTDNFGKSPLHTAAKRGCARCIEILLDRGARTDLKDSEGNTPLHISAAYGNLKAMEALYPASFEDESSVESVDEYNVQPHKYNEISSSFYSSPREYHSNESTFLGNNPDAWLERSSSRNQLNDSGYFSTRSNAWTKSSYFVPHVIEEERESVDKSSVDSISDSLTIETNVGGSEQPQSVFRWMFAMLLQIMMLSLGRIIAAMRIQQSPLLSIPKTEPPDHVREAMERFKMSRQETFKTVSRANPFQ
jgi:hypothetical protein